MIRFTLTALILLPFTLSCNLFSDSDLIWRKWLDGGGFEYARAITCTSDSGFTIAGHRGVRGHHDNAYVVKVNPSGREVWNYSHDLEHQNEATGIVAADDGAVAYVGLLPPEDSGTYSRLFISSLSRDGQPLWQSIYPATHYVRSYVLNRCPDGGFLIAGLSCDSPDTTQNGMLVVRYRANGNLDWTRVYSSFASAQAATALPDGGYAVLTHATMTPAVVRLQANGDVLWTRQYGEEDILSTVSAMCATEDGGLLLALHTRARNHGGSNAKLIRVDANGEPEWSLTLDPNRDDCIHQIISDGAGGFVAAGWTGRTIDWDVVTHAYLAGISSTGEVNWEKIVESEGYSGLCGVAVGPDGLIVAVGYDHREAEADSDIYLLAFQP